MAQDPYIDHTIGILRNLFDETDGAALAVKEFACSLVRAIELQLSPIEGKFDLDHLKAIHAYLFQDVYDWAGDVRAIGMIKSEPLLDGETVA